MKTTPPPSFLTDVTLAFVLLSRLPMPNLSPSAFDRGAHAVWAYPVVGAALGTIACALAVGSLALGMPASIAAGLAIGCLMLTSGAMHEDGLADTCDGFWGGQTTEQRLAIMKDSQIGTYGTLALIVTLGLRWSALSLLLTSHPLAMIAAAALSRAAMPVVMSLVPPARTSGLSQSVGRPVAGPVLTGLGLSLCMALAILGLSAVGALAVGAVAAGAVLLLARAKIGGQTGDVLGATQQLSELAVLLFCVLIFA